MWIPKMYIIWLLPTIPTEERSRLLSSTQSIFQNILSKSENYVATDFEIM